MTDDGPVNGGPMTDEGGALGPEHVVDVPQRWETLGSAQKFEGHVFNVRSDDVRMPDGEGGSEVVTRDVIEHLGAVGTLALDDEGRVLLIRQYRHPVGQLLWEAPAGLRDVKGESLQSLAERELLEEASYKAGRWDTLVDIFPSSGMSNERVRVFLARDVTKVPDDQIDFARVHEEADMPAVWVPLDEAVRKVLAGEIHNTIATVGILAINAARADGFASLRPPDAPEA